MPNPKIVTSEPMKIELDSTKVSQFQFLVSPLDSAKKGVHQVTLRVTDTYSNEPIGSGDITIDLHLTDIFREKVARGVHFVGGVVGAICGVAVATVGVLEVLSGILFNLSATEAAGVSVFGVGLFSASIVALARRFTTMNRDASYSGGL